MQHVVAQTSWNGTVSTSWTNAANWTNGVPSTSIDAIIGDENFTGNFHPDISSPVNLRSITIGAGTKPSTVTISKPVTINGNITIGSNGTLNHSSNNAISVRGNWVNEGSFNATHVNSTITFSGTTQSITGVTTFRRLAITAGSTLTLNSNITIARSLTVTGILDPNDLGYLVSFTGGSSFVVEDKGVLKVKASTFAGNYAANPTLNAGSIVEYASTTASQTIAVLTYSTLRIGGTTTKTPANTITLLSSSSTVGNLEVISGTLDLGIRTLNRGTTMAGGSITIASNAILKIGGTNTFPTNYAVSNFATTSTVEYNGANQAVSNQPYGNLILSSASGAAVKTMPTAVMTIANDFTTMIGAGTSVSFTAGAALVVNRNVTLGASTTFNAGTFNHTVSGNWTNNGTFNGSTGTITMNGTNKTIGGSSHTAFNNLTISGFGVTATASALTVGGNFTTSGAGSFTHTTGGTLTMLGSSKIISGNGITFNNLTISGSISTTSSFLVAGNVVVSGTINATGGTLEMSGAAKTISGAGGINLFGFRATGTISTTVNLSLKSDLMGVGKLTATAGTVSFIGTTAFAGSHDLFNVTVNGTSLQLAANATLGIAGAFAITAGTFDVTSTSPNTVSYNGAGAQSINATTYSNLIAAGGGTKTAAGNFTAANITINSSVTLSAGSHTHTIQGNWVNNGTFTAGTSTIQMTGELDASMSGATTFSSLTIAKSSSDNFVKLLHAVSAATINMTSGELHTGTTTVTITGTRTGNGIIYGTIIRTHAYTTGVAYAFESPFNTISFTSIVGSVSSITVKVNSASQEVSPLDGGINRNYTISMTNTGTYVATLRLHYLDTELSGNTEADLELWRYVSAWAKSGKSLNNTTTNWVENTLLSAITGRWTLSNNNSIDIWKGTTSSAWETASNWKSGSVPSSSSIIQLGSEAFTHQPTISTAVIAKAITFGSVQPVTLTLSTGGSATVSGTMRGEWAGNALHTVNVNAQSLTVSGDVILGYGNSSQAIQLNTSTGSISIAGSLIQTAGSTIVFSGSGNLNIGQHYTYSSGTFTAGAGTVTYSGTSSQTVANVTYNNLAFNKPSGGASISTALVINGNLDLSTGGVLDINANVTVGGNVSINTGVTVNENNAILTVGGNWTRTGVFKPTTGTVVFNGSNNQSISATTFNRVTINKPGSTAALTGNLVINGHLTVTAGTFDLGTYTANRSVMGGTLTLGSNAELRVGGAANFPGGFNTRDLSATSTVVYNGVGSQSVAPVVYGNLTLSNGASKSLTSPVSVMGDLLISDGVTFQTNAHGLTLQGNFTNLGEFMPSTGSVVLAGSSKYVSGSTTFNHLIITGSYSSQPGTHLTVNGNIDLSGSYSAGTNNIIASGNVTISGIYSSDGVTTYSGTRTQTVGLIGTFLSPNMLSRVVFDGTVPPILNSTNSPVFVNVDINNTSTIRPSVNWMVIGNFSVAPGSTFDGGSLTHTFFGSVQNNGSMLSNGNLNFTPQLPYTPAASVELYLGEDASFETTGNVTFGGSRQIILHETVNTFNNVIISNTHAQGVKPTGNWTIGGDFVVKNGALFSGGDSLTHNFMNDFTVEGIFNGNTSTVTLISTDSVNYISGSGTIQFHNLVVEGVITTLTDFSVSRNFTNNGIFAPETSSIQFIGTTPAVISGTTNPTSFDELIINKQGSLVSLEVGVRDITSLRIIGGTFLDAGLVILQHSIGGSLEVSSSATFIIDSLNTLPVFDNGYSFHQQSMVEYAGLAQSISPQQYGNLTLRGGLKTFDVEPTHVNTITNHASISLPDELTLSVTGDWINHGSVSANLSTVLFGGSAIQNISGASVTTFNNMSITNTANPVRIQSNQNLKGVLSLASNSTFDADGSANTAIFTLLSTTDAPTSDAAIAALPASAKILGNVTVQRFMSIEGSNNTRIYRYISSPVKNATVADLQKEIPVTGTFTGRSTCSGCGTAASLFYYDESVITDINNSGVADLNDGYIVYPKTTNTEKFEMGRGYSLFVRGNLIPTALWDLRGEVINANETPMIFPVSYTSSANTDNDGWNLVGNPFPSAIDWNAAGWTREGFDGTIYIRDNGSAAAQFAVWNGMIGINGGSKDIAIGQAFWAKANGSVPPVLRANENVKSAGVQTTFFRVSSISNLLRITMLQGSVKDETVIHFRDDATTGFDSHADAWKLAGSLFNLSTLLPDGKKLAINSLPAFNCSATVKLSVDNAAVGNYQFNFSELATFNAGITITLVDKFASKNHDVRTGNYSFSVTSSASSHGSNRFELVFSAQAAAANFSLSTTSAICEGSDAVITVTNSQVGALYQPLLQGNLVAAPVTGNGSIVGITIPKNKMSLGENAITIVAQMPACSAPTPVEKNINIVVEGSAISTVENGSVCSEGNVILKATSNSTTGSYRWYEDVSSTLPIAGQQASTFVTPYLTQSRAYYVSKVNSLGCEGARVVVQASVTTFVVAQITQEGSVLTSNYAQGNQWYLNDKILTDEINQTMRAEASGMYKVVVNSGTCSTSAEMPVVITSTEGNGDAAISLYPNPVQDKLMIEISDSSEDWQIVKVLNSSGVELERGQLSTQHGVKSLMVDLRQYPKGVYIIVISGKLKSVTHRILKK